MNWWSLAPNNDQFSYKLNDFMNRMRREWPEVRFLQAIRFYNKTFLSTFIELCIQSAYPFNTYRKHFRCLVSFQWIPNNERIHFASSSWYFFKPKKKQMIVFPEKRIVEIKHFFSKMFSPRFSHFFDVFIEEKHLNGITYVAITFLWDTLFSHVNIVTMFFFSTMDLLIVSREGGFVHKLIFCWV